MSAIQGFLKSMEKRSGLSELPVISWVSVVEGCPLSGVPLYSKCNTMATHILQCICSTPVLYMRTGHALYEHLFILVCVLFLHNSTLMEDVFLSESQKQISDHNSCCYPS